MYPERDITEYLQSVAASGVLGRSERRLALLEYLIRKEIGGEGESLKAYTIGVDVLQRKEDFDPSVDSSVRVEMGRLRTALVSFEQSESVKPKLCVEVPVGRYRPHISSRQLPDMTDDEAEKIPGRRIRALPVLLGSAIIAFAISLTFMLRPNSADIAAQNDGAVRIGIAPFEGEAHIARQVETAFRQRLARNPSIAVSTNLLTEDTVVDFSLFGLVSRPSADERRVTVELLNVHTNRVVWSRSLTVAATDDIEARTAGKLGNELVVRLLDATREFLRDRDPAELNDEQVFLMATWVPGPANANALEAEQYQIAITEAALARRPDSGTSHSVLADKLAQMANFYPSYDTDERFAEVDLHISRATELEPYHPSVMFNIAQAHWHAGRMGMSEAAMRRVVDLDPGHDLARFLSIVIPYTCQVPPPEVIATVEAYDQALAADHPIRWLTLTWIAWLRLNDGDLEGALEAKEAGSLIFETPYSFVGHAMLLNQLDRGDEAIEILRRQQLNWPGISASHFATVTMPRLCHESAPPAGLLEAYNHLAETVFGHI